VVCNSYRRLFHKQCRDGRLSSQEEWSSNPESECVDLSQKGREVFEKASNYLSDTLAGSKKRNR